MHRTANIALSLAALGLGTALAATPGFAQQQQFHYPVGRAANDGGLVTAQTEKGAERTGTNSNRQAFRSGREVYAFGGQGQSPRAAPGPYNWANGRGDRGELYGYAGGASPPAAQFHYPIGRAANDGGLVTAQTEKGAERTGTASNRQAFRSGSEMYAYGPQGQPPRTGPGPYQYNGEWER